MVVRLCVTSVECVKLCISLCLQRGASSFQSPSELHVLSGLPSRTCFFWQLMVTVCPGSVFFQLPCTDPSTVNPGHTDRYRNRVERATKSVYTITYIQSDPDLGTPSGERLLSTKSGFTLTTVTELVVQYLHTIALYAKGGIRLSNCPNLVHFLWYWKGGPAGAVGDGILERGVLSRSNGILTLTSTGLHNRSRDNSRDTKVCSILALVGVGAGIKSLSHLVN
eukprot:sb/3469724/